MHRAVKALHFLARNKINILRSILRKRYDYIPVPRYNQYLADIVIAGYGKTFSDRLNRVKTIEDVLYVLAVKYRVCKEETFSLCESDCTCAAKRSFYAAVRVKGKCVTVHCSSVNGQKPLTYAFLVENHRYKIPDFLGIDFDFRGNIGERFQLSPKDFCRLLCKSLRLTLCLVLCVSRKKFAHTHIEHNSHENQKHSENYHDDERAFSRERYSVNHRSRLLL